MSSWYRHSSNPATDLTTTADHRKLFKTNLIRQPLLEMLEQARASFQALIKTHAWVGSLANILPLSALVDFLNTPQALHVYQLTGLIPLWCWIITPSASRLLISQLWTSDFCFLDNFGHTQSLDCLDCRWGDCYPMANPETVRMCLKNIQAATLPNKHQNMLRKDIRRHTLEIILVKRDTQTSRRTQLPLGYILSSAFGWSIWVGLTIFTGLFHWYWAVGFLVNMPLTGIIISLFYSPGPRQCEYAQVLVEKKKRKKRHERPSLAWSLGGGGGARRV